MTVMHTKEEFVLDFMNVSYNPNAVTLGAKVISSPEHFKRIVAALQDNLKKYEEKFGPVESPAPVQPAVPTQEQSESSKFGF